MKSEVTIAGDRILNTTNIIYGLIFLFLILRPKDSYLITGVVIAVLYIPFSMGTCYFTINADKLIVNTYALPFYKIQYPLEYVKNIVIDSPPYKSPYISIACLQIINIENDRSSFYGASSLKKRHWNKLIEELQQRQIKVSVEASSLLKG